MHIKLGDWFTPTCTVTQTDRCEFMCPVMTGIGLELRGCCASKPKQGEKGRLLIKVLL